MSKRNNGSKRTLGQRERDRVDMADLYCKGFTLRKMAEKYGVSLNQVWKDIQAIKKSWRESTIRNFNECRNQELAKIDSLEVTYWEAWRKSEEPKLCKKSKILHANVDDLIGKPIGVEAITDQALGDSEYLKGVQWCIDRRCKLLGLDAPMKTEVKNEYKFSGDPRAELLSRLGSESAKRSPASSVERLN